MAHRDMATVPAADGGDRHGIVDPRAVDPRRHVQRGRIATDHGERTAGAHRRGVCPTGRRASQGHDAVGRKRCGTAALAQDQNPGARGRHRPDVGSRRRPDVGTRSRWRSGVRSGRWSGVRSGRWPGVRSRRWCRYRPDVGRRQWCRLDPGLVPQAGRAGWWLPGRRGAGRRSGGDSRTEGQGQTAQASEKTSQVNPPITHDDERTTASRAHPLGTVTDALITCFLCDFSTPAAVHA